MELSVFVNKEIIPDKDQLNVVLGEKVKWWNEVRNYSIEKYPKAIEEWNYPGKKYGWSYRIKDKKRVIVYLLPRDGFFKVAFVFGQKATNHILSSSISDTIKKFLQEATVYAEGRGIRIIIDSEDIVTDVKKLIDIKLAH